MKYLISRVFHVTYLPVDESGLINIDDLKRTLTDQTILVSIMTANNETGALQPIEEIGEILKDHQAYFHTDAVQAYSLLDIDVKKLGIDLLTTSAHRSEEHTSELQSRGHLVCRLLLETKKNT